MKSESPSRRRGERFVAGGKDALRRLKQEAREELRKPTTGAAIAGAVTIGAATIWGPAEAGLGALAAYTVYRILKKQRAPERDSGVAGS
jgi:hypothetical protein